MRALAPLPLFAIAITASASASAQQQVVFDVASSSTSAAAAAAVEDSLLFQAKLIRAAAAAKCTLVGDGIQRSAQTHQTVRRKQSGFDIEIIPFHMETSSSHEGSHDELVLLTAVNETALISAMGTVCNGLIKLEEVEESSDIKCMSSSQLLSLYTLDPTRSSRPKKAADIVEKIIDSGPPSNRIDVVFMGDGYTLSEKSKFFDDIRRLASDMWSDTTFATVRPLVNVWAVFRPSAFSGIGVGGRARDTPFGLYRDGTELRGIYCSKPSAARQACQSTGPDACDFPSLIGNDDYYGGLGGEFTISTRSILSGTVVLRHELGHNFISVGEEYDNGYVYSGVNSAPVSSLSNLKWSHWLTEGATSAKEQRSVQRLAAYPWYDLAAGPISYTFASDGSYARWMLRISASGVAEPDSLEVYLDGVKQAWTPRGDFDRAFYDYSDDSKGFSKGKHTLMVKQGFSKANSTAPIRQLCNLDLNEYGAEPTFHMNETYISAYPTWDINGRKSYRPTNEGCLMRNMAERRFCSPCMEGMWLRFLKKVALIDGIETTCSALPSERSGTINVKASLVPLAHLRPEESRVAGETIDIRWFKNSVEQKEFAGLTEFYVVSSTVSASDSWKLEVKFSTPEIRKDKDGVTASSKTFKLPRC